MRAYFLLYDEVIVIIEAVFYYSILKITLSVFSFKSSIFVLL
ncbi:hypothetical protein CHRY9393_02600 [Chryseobacterium fistulae]|uniref:Uncharacterized protein n=1 Tax=Chryseobacterium fistulae TaxID=2675058 RepID=A0A6N4XQZ5_9FLAO|nr:hypothetical protein CHRY9393_02600 [Chryseobacterium fistulae]